jgi:hypothetical protein
VNIPNWPLLTQAIEYIIDHPDKYDQSQWRCESTRCVAGWIAEFSGGTWYANYSALIWPKGADQEDEDNLQEADQCAIEALGVEYDITDSESVSEMISGWLFGGSLSWPQVLNGLTRLAEEDGVTLSPKIQAEIARVAPQEVPL